MSGPKHPGRTKAQRDALDRIGGGDKFPPMSRQTRDALLRDGLIVKVGEKTLGKDRFVAIRIPQYEMPVSVHYAWCQAMAGDPEE